MMVNDAMIFPQEDWINTLVRHSLVTDVGEGDASTRVAVDPRKQALAEVTPRCSGVTAGLPLLAMVYAELDPEIQVELLVDDGTMVAEGEAVARVLGPAAGILTGERTVLNFLQYLGGIATQTAHYVEAVAGTSCLVLDTRKTLPGYRRLAKYAVRCGGGHNHRFGLYDRIMLKDNHWLAARDGLADLVADARRLYPQLAIEVEVDDLSQLEQILPLSVEWILLDNFNFEETVQAVSMRNALGVASKLESSGNVNLETVGEYARCGVDAVSVGRLTHSVPAWDLGLDFADGSGALR